MPELPEVETTRRGLEPHLVGRKVVRVEINHPHLRWPIPGELATLLQGQSLRSLSRRGKYLLFAFDNGTLIIHLGMSGSLRIVPGESEAGKHEHFSLHFEPDLVLRLRDPRRFGAVLWEAGDASRHPLLAHLGVEPLTVDFSGQWLYRLSRSRNISVKQFLMDNRVVVGVGNIYANEALFRAGISPLRSASKIGIGRYNELAGQVKQTLLDAIEAGGSTLRDFVDSSGNPGYFQQQYFVYSRQGERCKRCQAQIIQVRQGQRSTFYCPACQT